MEILIEKRKATQAATTNNCEGRATNYALMRTVPHHSWSNSHAGGHFLQLLNYKEKVFQGDRTKHSYGTFFLGHSEIVATRHQGSHQNNFGGRADQCHVLPSRFKLDS